MLLFRLTVRGSVPNYAEESSGVNSSPAGPGSGEDLITVDSTPLISKTPPQISFQKITEPSINHTWGEIFKLCSWAEELSRINSGPGSWGGSGEDLLRLNSSELKNLASEASHSLLLGISLSHPWDFWFMSSCLKPVSSYWKIAF